MGEWLVEFIRKTRKETEADLGVRIDKPQFPHVLDEYLVQEPFSTVNIIMSNELGESLWTHAWLIDPVRRVRC